jgi:putative hydrolase of the HAD superfamily
VKAVGFDLWETLITDTPELSKAQVELRLQRMEAALASHGFSRLAHDIERAHRDLWKKCQELYWSRDEDIPCRRQIEHFLDELGLDHTSLSEDALAALEHAYARAAVEIPPKEVEGARETLDELRRRGLRIGLISNTGRTPGYALREILSILGLSESIDVMVFSNEHGVCKPQPSIFEELRRSLDTAPADMLFVGDNLHADVLGAQRSGIRGVHFDPPVRGLAVAPHVEGIGDVVPFARITRLLDLIDVVDRVNRTMNDER